MSAKNKHKICLCVRVFASQGGWRALSYQRLAQPQTKSAASTTPGCIPIKRWQPVHKQAYYSPGLRVCFSAGGPLWTPLDLAFCPVRIINTSKHLNKPFHLAPRNTLINKALQQVVRKSFYTAHFSAVAVNSCSLEEPLYQT